MKIAFITQGLPPDHVAGTEVYTYGIACALRDAGHQISVLCPKTWDKGPNNARYEIGQEDTTSEGIFIRHLSFDWRTAPDPHGYLFDYNPEIFKITKCFLQERKPDVVHITSCNNLSGSVISATHSLGLPMVLTMTAFWVICPRTTLLRRDGTLCRTHQNGLTCLHCLYGDTKTWRLLQKLPKILQHCLLKQLVSRQSVLNWNGTLNLTSAVERRNANLPRLLSDIDWVISPSNFLADMIAQDGIISRARIHVSPLGYNMERAEVGRHKTNSDYMRFGHIGSLVPWKGVHVLIEAFNQLSPDHQARLFIYGDSQADSSYVQRLRQMAADNPHILFKGRFNNSEIGHILKEIDVVVVPSLWYENTPFAILGAFAAKTPVIATNLGGLTEVVQHEVNGLVFNPGDVSDLARQMRRSIEEPTLVSRLKGRIAPVRSVRDEVEELEAVYARVINTASQQHARL